MRNVNVVIVGAGPTGLTAALELARHGIASTLLDRLPGPSEEDVGSRAIAIHRSALEVWERIGCAAPMLAEGVAWRTRRTFLGDREILTQELPAPRHGLPTFLNLQQYRTERHLRAAVAGTPAVEVLSGHEVTAVRQDRRGVTLDVTTSAGTRTFRAAYVLACDGARSSVRRALGLDFPGRSFPDRFLIADVRADLGLPPEPRFYFDHPAHPGSTLLVHPQPFGVWRVDWQLGSDADIAAETAPARMDERIRTLIRSLTGEDRPHELIWLSDYRFHQRLLTRLRHRRVFFLGDAGHLVAPFGARGMNGAILDVENLAWKLAAVLRGQAGEGLLESYQDERWAAQEHNRRVVDATMRFMAPRTRWQQLRRGGVLRLAARLRFAARWVDSGRMSEPFRYRTGALVADAEPARRWRGAPPVGAKAPDGRFRLAGQTVDLRDLLGRDVVALHFAADAPAARAYAARAGDLPRCTVLSLAPEDAGDLADRYAAAPGTLYVLRPDGHVAARRRDAGPDAVRTLLRMILKVGLVELGADLPQQRSHVGGDVDEAETGVDARERGPGA